MSKKIILKNYFRIFIMLFFVIWVSGCKPKVVKEKTADVIPVKVSRVELRELNETIDYIGDIKARNEAVIYPKVSGKVIEKVKDDGSFVNKGDVIAYIDRDEVGLKFEKAPVESSLTGIVGRIYVDIGTQVNQQTPIALVIDIDKVKIDLDIPEKYLPRISLGQDGKINIDAYPQREFLGQVTKISPVVDLATRTSPIEISVDNPEHLLLPGMFARVKLVLKKHENVPVILKESIIGKEPNQYVYITENNKAVSKKIILGINQGSYFEVREGLKEGDLVVIMGQQRLYDGADVKVEMDEVSNQ